MAYATLNGHICNSCHNEAEDDKAAAASTGIATFAEPPKMVVGDDKLMLTLDDDCALCEKSIIAQDAQ